MSSLKKTVGLYNFDTTLHYVGKNLFVLDDINKVSYLVFRKVGKIDKDLSKEAGRVLKKLNMSINGLSCFREDGRLQWPVKSDTKENIL